MVFNSSDQSLQVSEPNGLKTIRIGIWIYFLLLIFEGALRKWFLPGLATPILLIRDPLAIFLLFKSIELKIFRFNVYCLLAITIGLIGFFTAIFLGHKNFFVALYGARVWIVQFPMIFLIGSALKRSDVLKFGRFILWLTPLMTLLIAVQFYSPQSAWVNRGTGGNMDGAGFSGALGFFRPPGTFSFTNGTALFYSLAAAFLFYFLMKPEKVSRTLLVIVSLSLIAAIPLSISRTLFFSVGVTALFVMIAAFRKPRYLIPSLVVSMLLILCFAGLQKAGFFQTAIDAFTARFEMANENEGGLSGTLGDRYLGGMVAALTENTNALPFTGHGIGMGTNVGSILLTGSAQYLIAEGEWGRLIGEQGPLFGLVMIIMRILFSIDASVRSYRHLAMGDFLPWILLSFLLLNIPQGQWAQPTALGFSIFGAGLLMASLKDQRSIT